MWTDDGETVESCRPGLTEASLVSTAAGAYASALPPFVAVAMIEPRGDGRAVSVHTSQRLECEFLNPVPANRHALRIDYVGAYLEEAPNERSSASALWSVHGVCPDESSSCSAVTGDGQGRGSRTITFPEGDAVSFEIELDTEITAADGAVGFLTHFALSLVEAIAPSPGCSPAVQERCARVNCSPAFDDLGPVLTLTEYDLDGGAGATRGTASLAGLVQERFERIDFGAYSHLIPRTTGEPPVLAGGNENSSPPSLPTSGQTWWYAVWRSGPRY